MPTIKQEIARCRGQVFVQLHPDYTDTVPPLAFAVSKPEARSIVDKTPAGRQPTAFWETNGDLMLLPACQERAQ